MKDFNLWLIVKGKYGPIWYPFLMLKTAYYSHNHNLKLLQNYEFTFILENKYFVISI
jgi:hypothetical protein